MICFPDPYPERGEKNPGFTQILSIGKTLCQSPDDEGHRNQREKEKN